MPDLAHRRYGKKFRLTEIQSIGYEVHLADCPPNGFYIKSNACLYNQDFVTIGKNMQTFTWGANNGYDCYYSGAFNANWKLGTHKLQIWIGNQKIKKFFFEVI